MVIVAQRVKKASVVCSGRVTGAVGPGMLLLVGVSREDDLDAALRAADKIARLRIFEDASGKMNLDITAAGGAVLSVPQFTLLADTSKGTRPGFDNAAPPAEAEKLWKSFNAALKERGLAVEEGVFGEHMDVSLINDGPVTIIVSPRSGGGK